MHCLLELKEKHQYVQVKLTFQESYVISMETICSTSR